MNRSRLVLIALVTAMAALLSAITVLSVRWITAKSPTTSASASTPGLGFTRLDRSAPALSLPSLSGSGTVDLARLAGRPIVLNFWASTCAPCKSETPDLASAARALQGKVTFVGVDTGDERAAGLAFSARYHVPYLNAFDADTAAATRWSVFGLPATYFISPTGTKIVGVYFGALTPAHLRSILSELYHIT